MSRSHIKVTDVHVHMQPWETFRPGTLDTMKSGRADFDDIIAMSRNASLFLEYLDSVQVERAALINYPSPDIMGSAPRPTTSFRNTCRQPPNA